MAQVTIYMDEETEARTRAAAQAAGVSLSRWISELLRARTRAEWPADIAALEGCWRAPTAETSPGGSVGDDLPREPL